MHYHDLTPYAYLSRASEPLTDAAPRPLNVGWLEHGYPFNRAEPSADLVDRLWALCRTPVNATRGFHECEFCSDSTRAYMTVRRGDETIGLGHAEIWVFDGAGTVYVAPTLVYHYITAHGYAPPPLFVAALLGCPLPDTPEYDRLAGQFMWGKRMLREKEFERRFTNPDPRRDEQPFRRL
jgi:hypothetical protein